MFEQKIINPIDPLNETVIADYERINGDLDQVLITLGIVMLKPRHEKFNGFYGTVYSSSASRCKERIYQYVSDREINPEWNDPQMYVGMYTSEFEEINPKDFETIGYSHIMMAEHYIEQNAHCKTYILVNEKANSVIIFIPCRMSVYHFILSLFPRLYPQMFKDKPVTDKEYQYLMTLIKTNPSNFVSMTTEMLEPMRKEFICALVKECIDYSHVSALKKAELDFGTEKTRMEELYSSYVKSIDKMHELSLRMDVLKLKTTSREEVEEAANYMINHPAITNIAKEGSVMSFIVDTYLTNYDPDAWKAFDKDGSVYSWTFGTQLSVFKAKEVRKMLLKGIFETNMLKVRMCGYYRIDMMNGRLDSKEHYKYKEANPIYASRIPNPHLDRYNCLSQYRTAVTKCIQENNLIEAVDYCVASAGSVNLDEVTQNFQPLVQSIYSSTEKILVNNEGVEMTPEEAVVWLYDKEQMHEAS